MDKTLRKPKSSSVFDILINNRYVVNLIYDQYIQKGTYQSVYEYIQSDERCTDICKRDILNIQDDTDDDDKSLIDHLIDSSDSSSEYNQFNKVITIDIIKKILTMDKEMINDSNSLSHNKWMITQRLISNGYNKNPLYMAISKPSNEGYLSSVLVCGKCSQLMVGNNNRVYKGIRLKYYRCSNRIIPNKRTPVDDKAKIGCDCKNLVIEYINPIIFELLINIDIAWIDNKFIVKLYHSYRNLFISKNFDSISNKVKRSFVLIFINHIIWNDISNQLTVYLYDTTKPITITISKRTDNDDNIHGYSILNGGYYVDHSLIKIEKYYLITN